MIKKRFFSALINTLLSIILLINCCAQDTTEATQLSTQKEAILSVNSINDAVFAVNDVIGKSDLEDRIITGLQKKINSKPASHFAEEELQAFINLVLSKYKPGISQDAQSSLQSVLNFLGKRLSKYNISGVAFAFDPNAGFLNDNQNPRFTAVFKDAQGKIKKRTFDCLINSVGLKIALGFNFVFIFFTGDIDFENSNQVLKLGTGVDISTSILPILLPFSLLALHAPFKNAPGGITMIGGSLGLSMGLSMVTGGTLTPRMS
ncbi:hypothetical protein JST56_04690 [Candidatus Dependentiae bacterium]|nr:hypothetical protein [Candidatus Dependentiae bacterium]